MRKTMFGMIVVLMGLGCSTKHSAQVEGTDDTTSVDVGTESETAGGGDSDTVAVVDSESNGDTDSNSASDSEAETDAVPECRGDQDCFLGTYDDCCGCQTEYRCENGRCVDDGEWCYDSFCCGLVLPCNSACGVDNPDENYNGTCGGKDCNSFLESKGYDPDYFGCCPSGSDAPDCGVDITAMEWTDPGICILIEDPNADAGVDSGM